MPVLESALGITSALTQIGGTVSQVSDQKKRREYEQKLALLSMEERQKLERDLMRTNSKDKKLEILAIALSGIRSRQAETLITAKQKEQARRETLTALVVIGSAALVLVAVILIKKK